ncbi:MAG: hypothetical protein ACJ72O_08265 [Marmoricola sp.]
MPLPRSALLTLWVGACLRGSVGPDDAAVAIRGEDPQHLVVDWPEHAGALELAHLPAAIATLREPDLRLALPAAGDPLGLAGPPPFNADALEAGEAVIVAGRGSAYGLVPELDARTVLWRCHPVEVPPVLDPGEASRQLRQVLLSATSELVRLDVASWQPEIPDLMLNLTHRAGLPLPPGTSASMTETLERAVLCSDIVDLALTEHGGAVTSHEIAARAGCLTDLDAAARRAIVAVCSASLGAT